MESKRKPPSLRGLGILGVLGPGLAMAAAGVGAGDVTTPALGAAQFGLALLWVPIVAAILKFALNEGLARWQLATGETLLEGWTHRLGILFPYVFLVYLIVWAVSVFGALAGASGVAADMLFPWSAWHDELAKPIRPGGPQRSSALWSLLLLVSCTLLIWFGRYQLFERVMSTLTIVMVTIIVASACILFPADAILEHVARGPWLISQSRTLVFAILGGTGSTVGVLAYSYWMRERGREGAAWRTVTRIDLASCYVLSALFGVAITLIVGGISQDRFADILLESGRISPEEREAIAEAPPGQMRPAKLGEVFAVVAHRLTHETPLGARAGPAAAWLFKLALAAAVTSSLLGMLQSVPYFFADLLMLLKRGNHPHASSPPTQEESNVHRSVKIDASSPQYRLFLVVLAFLPIPLISWKQPHELVVLYAVWGSLFMPLLAGSLLVLNNRRDWMGSLANRWLSNVLCAVCLVLFALGVANLLYESIFSERAGKGPVLVGMLR